MCYKQCFYHGVPGDLPKCAFASPDLSWDIPITVDKRSDIQKMQPNVYLMRLTVTPFNSLLSTEWFFLALSRHASGWRHTWWSRSVFELHGPETMFQLSASVQAWIWSHSATESVKIQLMRPPERQQKKRKKEFALFDTDIPVCYMYLSEAQPLSVRVHHLLLFVNMFIVSFPWAQKRPWIFLTGFQKTSHLTEISCCSH